MRTSVAIPRVASHTGLGFSEAQARDLVSLDLRFGNESLHAYADLLDFESRSGSRTKFRRFWWRRIVKLQALATGLAWLAFHSSPAVELYKGMNLKLPWPTRILMASPTWLLLILAVVIVLPSLVQPEDRSEEEARMCWRLRVRLTQGLPFAVAIAMARSEFGHAWERIRGTLELLEHAGLRGQAALLAGRWAEHLEWELELQHQSREVRAFCWFLGAGAVNAWAFLVAIGLPFYQLIG